MKDLTSRPQEVGDSWDRAAQRFLALEALVRVSRNAGRAVGPEVEQAISAASKVLDFPANYDSPRSKP